MVQQRSITVFYILFVCSAIIACSAIPLPQASQTETPEASTHLASMPAPTPRPFTPDPLYSYLGNTGYDVLSYEIAIQLDTSVQFIEEPITLTAAVTLTLVPTFEANEFALDFATADWTLESVVVVNEVSTYRLADRKLIIAPQSGLRRGQPMQVAVTYSGPLTTHDPNDDAAGWFRYSHGLFTFHVPDGASTWFPSNDHPRDKATVTLRVTVDEPLVVAGVGTLQGVERADGRATYIWVEPHQIATYLIALVIAQQQEEVIQEDPIRIRNYFPLTTSVRQIERMRKAASNLSAMMTFFEQRFGPYPFQAYGIVVPHTSMSYFYAMEHQGLSMHGNEGSALDEDVVAHELAHQWFGNSVSLNSWQDMWLKEGLATYAQWLWEEHVHGSQAFARRIERTYTQPTDPWESYPPVRFPPTNELTNESVYTRGALTIHALRVRLGDDLFWELVRQWLTRYKYGNASSDDFITLAESVSGQELDAFFKAWLEQRAIPPISELGLPTPTTQPTAAP